MKIQIKVLLATCLIFIVSCGGKKEKEEGFKINRKKVETEKIIANEAAVIKASEIVDLDNKGIGPIMSLTLNSDIDYVMVERGKLLYEENCFACHRIGKKFIGSPPNGILERRTPEWVMNMILDPKLMVKEDPIAKQLLLESDSDSMEDQELSEEQARAILEYFRTLY